MYSLILTLFFVMQPFAAQAKGPSEHSFKKQKYVPEIVQWSGEVKDEPSSHTTEHKHELEFIKSGDGKTYDIVDSPELVKLHHESEKNFFVEIEAEKTPRFLFWGGNLIVRNFRVIRETSPSIPHRQASYSKPLDRSMRR